MDLPLSRTPDIITNIKQSTEVLPSPNTLGLNYIGRRLSLGNQVQQNYTEDIIAKRDNRISRLKALVYEFYTLTITSSPLSISGLQHIYYLIGIELQEITTLNTLIVNYNQESVSTILPPIPQLPVDRIIHYPKEPTVIEVDTTPNIVEEKPSEKTPKRRMRGKQKKGPCEECNTTSTVQWRPGPDGSTLCNACGLRFAKKKKEEQESQRKMSLEALLARPSPT